jgi:hypothetical protein
MDKFTSPLNNLKVASPCSQDWDAMIGSERKRFCGECKLNVYNLSGMTRTEAENLLLNSEGRLCVRFYTRADGTVLTQDCPVGWQAVKKRISRTAAAFVSLLFGLLSGLGLMSLASQAKREERLMGAIAYQPTPVPKRTPDYNTVMGDIAEPTPKPKATPKNQQATVGMIANRDFQTERSRERQ